MRQVKKHDGPGGDRGALSGRAMILYYSPRCGACRGLSLLAVLLAFGAIRRQAVTETRVADLNEIHPAWRGQPLIVSGDRIWMGLDVLKAVPISIAARIAKLTGRSRRHSLYTKKNDSRGI